MTTSLPYFDYFATTPLDHSVRDAMLPYLSEVQHFANSHSPHRLGHLAKEAVVHAKATLAQAIGGEPEGVYFTSGATESIHLALRGAALFYKRHGQRVLTTPIEHSAVLDACHALKTHGILHDTIPLNDLGIIDIPTLNQHLPQDTLIVSVPYVNNEVGLVQPIAMIAEHLHQHGILLHVDAAQALGRVPLQLEQWGVDFCSLSAHKAYGPKGVGALYIRQQPGRQITSLWYNRQGNLRPGTQALHQIIGMAEAAKKAETCREKEYKRIEEFSQLIRQTLTKIQGASLYESPHCLPHVIQVSLPHIPPGHLVHMLSDDAAIATGAACQTSQTGASPTLRALGLSYQDASHSYRISMGRFTNMAMVRTLCDALSKHLDTTSQAQDMA